MLLTGFPAGMLACNCYVLAPRQGSDAIVVDPGQRAFGPLRRILDENRLTPAAVLLTHGHIDHIWSAQKVADTFGCPVYIHPADRSMLTDPIRGFGPRIAQVAFGAMFREPRQVVELDSDGQTLDLGGIAVTVDHTPGHTRGSVTFRVSGQWDEGDPEEGDRDQGDRDQGDRSAGSDAAVGRPDLVFTGDTLFNGSVGRTDLPGGSGRDMIGSIMSRLMVLDDDTRVLPGHGEASTIGVERRTNPFLQGLVL